jgi:hypothetical protein
MQIKSKYKAGYRKKGGTRKNIFLIVSAILLLCVIGLGCYLFYYTKLSESSVKKEQGDLISVYTAMDSIQHGQIITSSMLVEAKTEFIGEESFYSTLDCIGKIAIVDIPKGMTLMQNMYRLPELSPDDREVECEIISLSDNLIENDYVDLRLMLPNGEDYIVLAKKGVHNLYRSEDEQEEVCYLWLSEEEILYYSSAVVDAYLYQGACLYTTKYIEPTIQEASIVTFVPSLGTIEMMKENPNLYEIAVNKLKLEDRKLLENRLTDYLNLDIRERNWNVTREEPSKEPSKEPSNEVSDNQQTKEEHQEEQQAEEQNANQNANQNENQNEVQNEAQKVVEADETETSDFWNVRWDLTERGKAALENAGLGFPFPQRDVHLQHPPGERERAA